MEGVPEYNGAEMAHGCDKVVIDHHSFILVADVPTHKGGKPTDDEDNGDIPGVDGVETGSQK